MGNICSTREEDDMRQQSGSQSSSTAPNKQKNVFKAGKSNNQIFILLQPQALNTSLKARCQSRKRLLNTLPRYRINKRKCKEAPKSQCKLPTMDVYYKQLIVTRSYRPRRTFYSRARLSLRLLSLPPYRRQLRRDKFHSGHSARLRNSKLIERAIQKNNTQRDSFPSIPLLEGTPCEIPLSLVRLRNNLSRREHQTSDDVSYRVSFQVNIH